MALESFYAASLNQQPATTQVQFFHLAGTIRNIGAGWFFINDAGHKPLNFGSVVTSATEVALNFIQVASKVCTFIVVPDETYAQQNIFCGASVDLDKARIQFYDKTGALINPNTLTSALGNFWVYGLMYV